MIHTGCALLIRLFDGSPVKHKFEVTDTLEQVRKFLDIEDAEYTFFLPIEKKMFQKEEEQTSLGELGLAPSAALVLKVSAPKRVVVGSYSIVKVLIDAVYTFLGIGYIPPPREGYQTALREDREETYHQPPSSSSQDEISVEDESTTNN